MVRHRRSRGWWARTVAGFSASGLTQVDFCRRVGVDRSTFRKWQRDLGAAGTTDPAGALVRVELDGWPSTRGTARTLVAAVGYAELRFEEGTDAGYVGAVVTAIGQAMGRC